MKLSERLRTVQQRSKTPATESSAETKLLPTVGAEPAIAPAPARNETPEAGTITARATSTNPTSPRAARTVSADDALTRLKNQAAAQLFERIGARLHDRSMNEQQLHALVRSELNIVVEEASVPLTRAERKLLMDEVQFEMLGYGPLQRLLDDPEVTEVMVNGPDMIYVEKAGKLQRSSVRFASEEHLRLIIERIVTGVGRRIDESSPMGRRSTPGWITSQCDYPAVGI